MIEHFVATNPEKVKEMTLGEYISSHTDAMSSHLFGFHLPHFELPSWLSFLNNGIMMSDGKVTQLKLFGESPAGQEIFQLTAQMVIMLIAGLMVLSWAKFSYKKGKLTRMGHALEALLLFVRDDLARPNMSERLARAVTPFLATLFFFILIMNYLSLVPGAATPTANISLTATLAVFSFLVTNFLSIKELGLKHYLAHLTGGTHWLMWIIMVPIEFISLFTKPFALAVRLFANMTAGHIIIYALLGLVSAIGTVLVSPVSVGMALFVNMLELLVAFLQAFIFTMLTALFIGLATTVEHSDEEHAH
jgi:F-type H+-transporting ATPase subunit a